MTQLWETSENEERAKAEKQNVKFITVDKMTFQEAVKPMYDDIAKTNPELSEMVDRIRTIE
ncbi:hypothetical protein SAMN05421784_14421 [Xenorhabdus koppenhoeferi]|uniref:Uncharacterized protein n=2 Tax=Xenorhabdus TaxID=626 RepID=A0A1I7K258_9GAMM|nr:hypothetical protein SAMN05421784_14421 [Xenorhabdus koppenhoeferi]